MKNYYTILGIQPSASDKEIKQAYRTMAVIYHPDKNQGDNYAEEKFKEINEAYQILSNISKKSQFDLILNYNLANKQKQQYSYNPNERSRPQYSPTPRPRYRESEQQGKPTLSFEDSIRNLSEKNFLRIGILVVLVVSSIIGLAEYISYQRDLNVEKRIEKTRLFLESAQKSTLSSIKKNDFDTALKKIDESQNLYPNEYYLTSLSHYITDSLQKRANFYFQNRNYDKALNDLAILLKYNKYYHGETPLMYGRCLIELGQKENALSFLTDAANNWNKEPQIYFELAKIEYNYDSLSLANRHISIAENILKNRYIRAYGQMYHFNANTDNIPYFHYDIYMFFAQVKLDLNDSKEALKSYKWAEFLQPNLPLPLLYQANIYLNSGEKEKACAHYKEAVNLGYDPNLIKSNCEF